MALLQYQAPVDYAAQLDGFKDFLQNFKSMQSTDEASATEALRGLNIDGNRTSDEYDFMDDAEEGTNTRSSRTRQQVKQKYMQILQDVANRDSSHILIELDDLDTYEKLFPEEERTLKLVESIQKNTKRYIDVFSQAVDAMMPAGTKDTSFKDDVLDIIMSQRSKVNETLEMNAEADMDTSVDASMFPPELTRRYTLNFKPITPSGSSSDMSGKALAVRNVRGEHLGSLITVRGITTRVSDVKPAVLINAYTCDRCGSEVFQPVVTKQFTPLSECLSEDCKKNNSKGQLFLSTRASKFVPFQEVKIQEMADQVPVGHIPRTLTVHCHGALTRTVNPGDIVDIGGIFLPTPYTGFKAIRAGLLTDTYLEAQHITQHKKSYQDMGMDARTLRKIEQYQSSGNMYEYLSRSIAPEIYGHLDVKKALLLLLIGGVTKEMGDGMHIRGDINICLMGDPGVAKSQLLRYITKVAPRGVYTTGRGSSGVGLTAAVMRDPVTDEMVLEGGALVLADNGICCIDEFDKMEDSDRTAIHEVMEQQTISISKAGINTTLNARTSILAAANPLYGRYNPRISPVENINLPAALLSRFDVMFLLLDTPSRDTDEELANHVTYVHMHNKHPETEDSGIMFTPHEVRQYIAKARTFRPIVPSNVSDYMVGAYVAMRKRQKKDEAKRQQFSHVTPRTLLGIVRLSQALARLRFSEEVVREDVDEALRIIEVSKSSLYNDREAGADHTPTSKIYTLIRNLWESGAAAVGDDDDDNAMSIRRIRERVLAKGFTDDQLTTAIHEYTNMNVWQTSDNGARLMFVNADDEMMG
ncbi:DNA replication licensing factor MCM7 [Penicillium verhagenii]|uniref:DNA replication licensing factor MCM7 n=1 Tax=Penicillium verhagenii TaxID=1562060 RepID=UPI002545340A|nr:DNA replication licensing factor MCM7 [Penicillium verhagenii]KAJ5938612.1 DNA replication licensing factor MCM7 [Penicillium verhagenii]